MKLSFILYIQRLDIYKNLLQKQISFIGRRPLFRMSIIRSSLYKYPQKLSSDEVDYFSKLADLISSRAPKINIPWLQASASATVSTDPKGMLENVKEEKKTCTTEPQETVNCAEEEKDLQPLFPYLPLAIKKTIITPKKMKR